MPDCIAIIPAKGTSRRIPRKNLAFCGGKSLVSRAVDTAGEARVFSEIILSSEDIEIRFMYRNLPWPLTGFRNRPRILSEEGVGVAAVVLDVLAWRNYEPASFCVLWPTSPLRTPEQIRAFGLRFQCERHAAFFTCAPNGQHEGTAIFMRTEEFLRRLSLDMREYDMAALVEDSVDVNTPEDLAEAERRLLAREAVCPSS